MYKTPEEQKLEDDSNKYFYMNKVIDNIKVKQQNGRLWTPYHDMQLYEYVIKYKFNFYEISNAFQRLCTNDKKYEYSEDAVRLHWAFLHAMRHFDQTPDEAYYQRMKLQYDKEKPKTFKKRVEEKEKEKLTEEEDIKKMKEEFEKMMKEKNEENNKDNIIENNIDNNNTTKVELDKKEEEEVDKLINETKRKKEEENIEEEKNNNDKEEKDINQENNENDNKEEKNDEKKEDNKLYDENDEPEYIKQLFNKTIPQEILDKLNKDQGKYNSSPEKETKKDNPSPLKNEINTESSSNPNQTLQNSEQSPKKEINTQINIENEDDDLFPIKSYKQKEISEPGKFENINMEKELQNTQDFHDYIESNPELKKQYEQLNNYCNFAVKSINYLVNKSTGLNDTSSEEAKKIEQTNKQLNELLLEPIIKETKEKGYTLEEWNKKIEEEESRMHFETTNYDNYMKNAPKDEDRDMKLNKFKEHLFSFAEKISTEELLEKITGIINQNNANSDDNNENNGNNDENNNNINNIQPNNNNNINNIENNVNNNNNNINLQNAVQNFMNNLENNGNNIEDEKSEITKEQSESVNENLTENNGRNTISSINSLEFPKKYRHVYRGMVYYDEKPNQKDKNNKNNNRANNKKKIQEDDEIEEDDDEDEEEYNK